MGLDSVELIMEMEEYFQIEIPDPEAEQMVTVQLAVDGICKRRGITEKESPLKEELRQLLLHTFKKIGIEKYTLLDEEPIFTTISPEDADQWKRFSQELGLKVPKPNLSKPKLATNPLLAFLYRKTYDWRTIPVSQFIEVLAASNRSTFIEPSTIKSSYEVYIGVMAITEAKCGVDIYEIQPHKSWTSDFGID